LAPDRISLAPATARESMLRANTNNFITPLLHILKMLLMKSYMCLKCATCPLFDVQRNVETFFSFDRRKY
jgi:hypothetical protein